MLMITTHVLEIHKYSRLSDPSDSRRNLSRIEQVLSSFKNLQDLIARSSGHCKLPNVFETCRFYGEYDICKQIKLWLTLNNESLESVLLHKQANTIHGNIKTYLWMIKLAFGWPRRLSASAMTAINFVNEQIGADE